MSVVLLDATSSAATAGRRQRTALGHQRLGGAQLALERALALHQAAPSLLQRILVRLQLQRVLCLRRWVGGLVGATRVSHR